VVHAFSILVVGKSTVNPQAVLKHKATVTPPATTNNVHRGLAAC
jgi:hypothetical protein